jgi:transcriptional regulator with XRE-family HTH domain
MSNIGNKEIFSKNLKHYIDRSGKDRRELAEIWGFPYSTVTEWINGRKYPRIDRIEIMADYFGILKSDLIEDTKEKPTAQGDGLSVEMQELIDCVKKLPEDKIQMLLQVARSIQ